MSMPQSLVSRDDIRTTAILSVCPPVQVSTVCLLHSYMHRNVKIDRKTFFIT